MREQFRCDTGEDGGAGKSRRIIVFLVLLAAVGGAVVAAHWPCVSAKALMLDDDQYLVENRLVQNPGWTSAKRFLAEVLRPSTVLRINLAWPFYALWFFRRSDRYFISSRPLRRRGSFGRRFFRRHQGSSSREAAWTTNDSLYTHSTSPFCHSRGTYNYNFLGSVLFYIP